MIQIIDARKLLKNNLNKLGMISKDSFIFVEESVEENYYTRIVKFNYILKDVDEFKLKRPAQLISNVNLNKVVYYVNTSSDLNKQECFIDIHKLNCDDFMDDFIMKIDIGKCKHISDLSYGGILVGIDDRYAILMLPGNESGYKENFFNKALLIDSFEKKSYLFNNIFEQNEAILKTDKLLVDCNGKHIIFKTGRIGDFEKKQFYDQYKNNSKEIYDEAENLIICEKDEFINVVKNRLNLNKDKIIENCNCDKSLRFISMDNDKIYYLLSDFANNLKQLKSCDFESKEIETIEVKEKYDYIEMYNNKFYGFINKENNCKDLYDIKDDSKIFKIDGEAVYVDEKVLVSGNIILKDNKFIRQLIVYNLSDGNILNDFEFTNICFDSINEIIVFW